MSHTAIISVIVVAFAGVARADANTASAKAHYEKGTTLYDLGRYLDAAHEYEEAYAAKNDPALLFNVAQAYRLGGDNVAALRTYRSFLRRMPDTPNRADVERHIANLQHLIDEQKRTATSPPVDTMAPGATQTPPGTAPPPTATPPSGATTAPALIATAAPEPPRKTPLYKKWWLWTAVAGVVVVGVGVGVAVAETTPSNASAPAGTLPVSFP